VTLAEFRSFLAADQTLALIQRLPPYSNEIPHTSVLPASLALTVYLHRVY